MNRWVVPPVGLEPTLEGFTVPFHWPLELAKLPIDRLKDATEETVRVETLRKYGFENVASIYNSSAIQLERIPGITLSAAQSLKALADQMYQAVAQSISYGIDIDELTRADSELIENLQGLDYLRAEMRSFNG